MFRKLVVALLILAPSVVLGAEPAKIRKPAHMLPVFAAKWNEAHADYEVAISEARIAHLDRLAGLTSDEEIRFENEKFAFILELRRSEFKAAEARILEEQAQWRIAAARERRAEQQARNILRQQQIQAANAAYWYQVNRAYNGYYYQYGYQYRPHCYPQSGFYNNGVWFQVYGY